VLLAVYYFRNGEEVICLGVIQLVYFVIILRLMPSVSIYTNVTVIVNGIVFGSTPHIATFGGTSYQISNIGSVRVMQRKKYNPLAVIIFLLGLGILAAAMVKSRMTGLAEESFSMAATGIAVVIGAFLLQLIWPLRVYVVVLRTSGGDVDAVVSRNKEFVSNVQKAVEQAFAVRARQPPVSET